MTRYKGPILTLLAGLVVAAILMVLNLSVTKDQPVASAGDVAAAGPATTTRPATPTAAPTQAPTTPPPAATGVQVTYAGKVKGGGATVAIAITDGRAIAYVCDGRSAEAWLQGPATGGVLDLTGASDARLTGTYGNGVAAGSVSAAGRQFTFSVKTVTEPSGLYRAAADVRGAKFVAGWIVLADGQQVGLATLDGVTQQLSPLDLTTRTAPSSTGDGPITATLVDGSGR